MIKVDIKLPQLLYFYDVGAISDFKRKMDLIVGDQVKIEELGFATIKQREGYAVIIYDKKGPKYKRLVKKVEEQKSQLPEEDDWEI